MSKLAEITDSSFKSEVLQSPVPVAVEFYSDRCGPCRMLKPILELLADDLTSAKIVSLDVATNDKVVRRFAVSSIPTVIVFKDGQEVHRMVGLSELGSLREALGE